MLITHKNRIRNGIAITIESIKLLFSNPILFVYTLLPLVMISIWYISMGSDFILTLKDSDQATAELTTYKMLATFSIVFVSIFCCCCLARHTMYILRQQPASVRKSFMWIVHHFGQILLWIILASIPFLNFEWLKDMPSPASRNELLLFLFKWSTYLLIAAASWVISFVAIIIIPIISSEKISITDAIKRAWLLIFNYLEVCIAMGIAAIIIYGLPIILLRSLLVDAAYAQLIQVVTIPLSIIANMILYYEFYLKREHASQ